MLDWMLDTGEPVPANIVRELMALKRNPGCPRMPYTPSELLTRIYTHMAAGLPRDDAIAKVAEEIGFGFDTVKERADTIKGEARAYVKTGVYSVRDLLVKPRQTE